MQLLRRPRPQQGLLDLRRHLDAAFAPARPYVIDPVLAARGEMGQRCFHCTGVYPGAADRGRLTPGNASPFR